MKITAIILRSSLLGAVIGFLYAFISFILITSSLKNNLMALFYFAIQGSILALCYSVSSLICYRSNKQTNMSRMSHAAIGALSGAISSGLSIGLSIYNSLIIPPFAIQADIKNAILRQLFLFFIGSSLIGVIVGLVTSEVKGRRDSNFSDEK